MIIAIDIGNTNIVFGCIEEENILFYERLSTDRSKTGLEYALTLRSILDLHGIGLEKVEGAIVASVVPPLTAVMEEALNKTVSCRIYTVGPGLKTGLQILLDNPAQVGADLIVGAVAGIRDYTCPLILIDMGTATTICVIDGEKRYTGGMILPGLMASLDSLILKTSQLPRISLDPPKRLIGKNTVECMKSGILHGSASMLDGMIDRIEDEIKEKATCVATGGLAGVIVPLCRHEIILDDELLLRGLNYLYRKNA